MAACNTATDTHHKNKSVRVFTTLVMCRSEREKNKHYCKFSDHFSPSRQTLQSWKSLATNWTIWESRPLALHFHLCFLIILHKIYQNYKQLRWLLSFYLLVNQHIICLKCCILLKWWSQWYLQIYFACPPTCMLTSTSFALVWVTDNCRCHNIFPAGAKKSSSTAL